MIDSAPVSTIAHLIQLAIAPVFLLAGIGAILNVMANRLARVVDRVRTLERGFGAYEAEEEARARTEIRVLARRIRLVNNAITGCTASALFVCLVVAVIFAADFFSLEIGRSIAVLFILAMGLLIIGLILFLMEVRLAARSLRVRPESLRADRQV